MTQPGRLIASGHEADIHQWSPGEVIKLWRDPSATARADREAAVLRVAASAGLPAPAVVDRVDVAGRPGLVLQHIAGVDLAAQVRRRPWRVRAAARVLARSHARIHQVIPPAWLPSLAELIVAKISRSPLVDEELRRRTIEALAALDEGGEASGRLCHGNLHLANIVMGRQGPVLLDWADAARGDPDSEVALTLVRYRVARSGGRKPLPAPVDAAGRHVLRRAYLRAYEEQRSPDPHRLATWQRVRAVERITEGNPHEKRILTAIARPETR
ncbi:MAG TPA: phosphotransferase [Acidimicrobiales bacterium]|nr:phosphotransferase [Acidimicrobiales bacterium]